MYVIQFLKKSFLSTRSFFDQTAIIMPMKDSLIIGGRIYISSRRAAEISRYSNDYVGQLCRGGKVPAQMMGRAWFIDQEALLKHKKDAEEAFQARCRAVSRDQQKMFAIGGAGAGPSYSGTWTIGSSPATRLPINPSPRSTSSASLGSTDSNRTSHLGRKSMAVALVVVILAIGGVVLEKNNAGISHLESSSQMAHVYASVERAIGAVRGGFDRVMAFFNRDSSSQTEYAVNTQVDAGVSSVGNQQPWNGMAVVPSSTENDETKDKIKQSFSDVVTVKPDQSGTAGVITPVFNKTHGDDFMYVLVPVKEEKK
jgi:hypothetical protein